MVLPDQQKIRRAHRPPGEILFTVITSLKYSQRGRRQLLRQTLDVGDVLLLPSKYVNDLIKIEKTKCQRLSDPRPGVEGGGGGSTCRARSRAEACGKAL